MENPNDTHAWDSHALYLKAQRFAKTMMLQDQDSWQYVFWSSVLLEILGRAALAHTSPMLLADAKGDWKHQLFAVNKDHNILSGHVPKSINTSDVFKRLHELHTDIFSIERVKFSRIHLDRRNEELHTALLPFDELGSQKWLPEFYKACAALLEILESRKLANLFNDAVSEEAATIIQSYDDKSAKSILQKVNDSKIIWDKKSDTEREELLRKAQLQAVGPYQQKVTCPACKSTGLVSGVPVPVGKRELDEDNEVIFKQPMRPERLWCIACELEIVGHSKLVAVDESLGNNFVVTKKVNIFELYESELERDFEQLVEDRMAELWHEYKG